MYSLIPHNEPKHSALQRSVNVAYEITLFILIIIAGTLCSKISSLLFLHQVVHTLTSVLWTVIRRKTSGCLKWRLHLLLCKQTQIFFCCIALSQYYRIKTCQGRRDTLRTRRHATSGHRVQMKLKFCCYNHTTSCPTLRVTPSWRKQGNPPCMSTEKAANAKLTERNLETTFKFRMFSVWCNTFGNALAVYQKLSSFLLQVRGHKINNRNIYTFLQFYKIAVHFVKNVTWWNFFLIMKLKWPRSDT